MKATLLALIVLFSLSGYCQQTKVTYYKDLTLTKEVKEKKAKIKKVETTGIDSSLTIEIVNLEGHCTARTEKYKNNRPVGVWKSYSSNCSIYKKRDFSKLIYAAISDPEKMYDNTIEEGNPDNCEKTYFGDNEMGIYKYLGSNLGYPKDAKNAQIEGTVFLQIIIKADGSVGGVSILKGAHPILDYTAYKVISDMPAWKPARKDGKPVDSFVNFPVRFKLK